MAGEEENKNAAAAAPTRADPGPEGEIPVAMTMKDIMRVLDAADASKEEKKEETKEPIPVTLLSGFLGAGKTSLLKNILESNEHGLKIAVIVNDMAELNIDGALVQQGGTTVEGGSQVVQAEREVITLQNGCICCTLRGDLIREIARIRDSEHKFDYVLIESTGIAEPQQVAESFCFDPNTAQLAKDETEMLWKQARLDTCVTVVDCHSFLGHMTTLKHFADEFDDGLDASTEEGKKEGEKGIAHLLTDQVEFANVILLNKTDLATPEEIKEITRVIKYLNPKAKLMQTEYSKIDLEEILNTKLFDMDEAARSPGWLLSLRGEHPQSEADEYGVVSFIYRARVPFHMQRLAKFMDEIMHFSHEWKELSHEQRQSESDKKQELMVELYGTIMRAKGFCWLAGKDSYMFGYAQSGRIGGLLPIIPWYTLIPREHWGAALEPKDIEIINSKFEEPHGDRRQEIVFIGTGLKEEAIKQDLDLCLLTKSELSRYKFYSDNGFE